MSAISLAQWRNNWEEYADPPDPRDRERERTFLRDHARYGAAIHLHSANALADAAIAQGVDPDRRLVLLLRLFAEFVTGLESLGAWGWTLQRRRTFRLFLDGFLAYPTDAAEKFFRGAARHEGDLVTLLELPERELVVRAFLDLVPNATDAQVNEYLDGGLDSLKLAADQFFEQDSALLTYYNKAKHGATMVRLEEHTNTEFDFQVIAPQRNRDSIAAGAWYDVSRFEASDEMIGRIRQNCHAMTESIRQLAMLTWALYEAGLLYTPAE